MPSHGSDAAHLRDVHRTGAYCCFASNAACLRAGRAARRTKRKHERTKRRTARGNRTPTAGVRGPSPPFRPGRFGVRHWRARLLTWHPKKRVRPAVRIICSDRARVLIHRDTVMELGDGRPAQPGQSAGGAGTQSRGYLLHYIGHGAGRWTLALLLPHVVGLAFRARGGVVDGITHGAGLAVPACRLVWWCCGARRRRVAVALPARSPLDARRCVAPLALKPRSGLPSCSSIALAAGRAESSVGHEHASPETIGSSRQ